MVSSGKARKMGSEKSCRHQARGILLSPCAEKGYPNPAHGMFLVSLDCFRREEADMFVARPRVRH
jgi:hypothetical protein